MQLPCLSVQQPWADLILDGKKLIENRPRSWLPHRNWEQEGSVLLAIHASRGVSTWRKLNEKQREYLAPGWRVGDGAIGVILGVVDVVRICTPSDLPAPLRRHKYTIDKAGNWCWVLENPRRFPEPIPFKANVFTWPDLPDQLLPSPTTDYLKR